MTNIINLINQNQVGRFYNNQNLQADYGYVDYVHSCGRLWESQWPCSQNCQIYYVAISHVWIDGLGNPNANSLPVCQLACLRHLLEEVLGNFNRDLSHIDNIHRNPEKSPRPLFWLYTLLRPAGPPEHKKLSLQKNPSIQESDIRSGP